MVISDTTILGRPDLIEGGNPLIGPASVDLTLSSNFLVVNESENIKQIVNPQTKDINGINMITLGEKVTYNKINKDEIMIPPLHFVLASTEEIVHIPNDMCGFVAGRSSVARSGLQIECAGFIDPGFSGRITLELYNQNPNHFVTISKGLRLCQIIFMKLDRECLNPYDGKYQGQTEVTESRMEKDNEQTSD